MFAIDHHHDPPPQQFQPPQNYGHNSPAIWSWSVDCNKWKGWQIARHPRLRSRPDHFGSPPGHAHF